MKHLIFIAIAVLLALPVQAATFDATVTWTSTSTNHQGFRVYRDGALIGQTGPAVMTFTDSGLSESTTYCYQIGAYNAFPSELKGAQTCGTTGVVVVPVNGSVSGPIIIFIGKP